MPPVPITFHAPSRSSSAPLSTPASILSRSEPYKRIISSGSRSSNTKSPTQPYVIMTEAIPPISTSNLASPPQTGISSSSTPATYGKRRKTVNSVAPPDKVAHLTPLLQPILSRCLASKSETSGDVTPTISPPFSGKKQGNGSRKAKATQISWPVVHPYSRLTDLGNNRSNVPSPKEIARAQRLEANKIRAKKDGAAAARAKRKKGTNGNGKRSVSGRPVTRSVSPVKAAEEVPTIVTEPASAESSPHPVRAGLKRTRSQGLLPISTSIANAHGTGTMGVGSPLKAVTGPDGEEEKEAGRSRKRSRLSDDAESLAPPRSARRANTTSPVSNASPLPTTEQETLPSTLPVAQPQPLPRTAARSLSVAPATNMKRAVSAGVRGVGMGRTASAGAEAVGKERVKRETKFPITLRDYVGASGTVV